MMEKLIRTLVILSIFVVSGCASLTTFRPSVEMPKFTKDSYNVYVASDVVDKWTDVPGGAHLVKNSQIYLTGKEIDNAGMLGLLGVAIDKSINSPSLKGGSNTLSIKFDAIVKNSIQNEATSTTAFNLVDKKSDADFIFYPLLYLNYGKSNDKYHEELRLKMKVKNPETGKMLSRTYTYVLAEFGRSIKGDESWSVNGGEKVRELAEQGLPILVKLSVSDILGKYEDKMYKLIDESEIDTYSYKRDPNALKRTGHFLDSFEGHHIIVPVHAQKLLNNYIAAIPQSEVIVLPK